MPDLLDQLDVHTDVHTDATKSSYITKKLSNIKKNKFQTSIIVNKIFTI